MLTNNMIARAAVAYGAGEPLVVQELRLPAVGRSDVVVALEASGICHTDLAAIDGRTPTRFPFVPGHEGCGVVEEVGPDVRRVRPGDRVLVFVAPACGSCWWCVRSLSHLCPVNHDLAGQGRWPLGDGRMAASFCGCGTFSDRTVVHEASVVPVTSHLPASSLALLGCGVATGLGAALNTAAVTPGSSVVVLGCGGVGQAVVQGARIAGASVIVAVDPAEGRRRTAAQVGATHVLDPASDDVAAAVQHVTEGRGADHTFEVVGRPELVLQALALARRGGTVTMVGMPDVEDVLALPLFPTVFSGKRLAGSVAGDTQLLRDIPRYVAMAEAGQLDLGAMVSGTIELAEVNDGLRALASAEGVRTVVAW